MSDTFGKENRATPAATLEQQILDPNHPKNDGEWWAADEITALRAEVDNLKSMVIAQEKLLRSKDAENERLRAEVAWHVEDKNKWQDTQAAHLREVTRLTARVAELEEALKKAKYGLDAGVKQYANRDFYGNVVPGDEQAPWVKAMQIGLDASRAALTLEKKR